MWQRALKCSCHFVDRFFKQKATYLNNKSIEKLWLAFVVFGPRLVLSGTQIKYLNSQRLQMTIYSDHHLKAFRFNNNATKTNRGMHGKNLIWTLFESRFELIWTAGTPFKLPNFPFKYQRPLHNQASLHSTVTGRVLLATDRSILPRDDCSVEDSLELNNMSPAPGHLSILISSWLQTIISTRETFKLLKVLLLRQLRKPLTRFKPSLSGGSWCQMNLTTQRQYFAITFSACHGAPKLCSGIVVIRDLILA